ARAIEDAQAQDLCYDQGWLSGTVHPMIRELIRGNTLGVERAKAGFVAKERTAGHGHAARQKRLDGSIEPNDGDTLRAKEFRSALLRICPPAEGEHNRFLGFGGAADNNAKLVGFDGAKSGLTEPFKEFRDAKAR